MLWLDEPRLALRKRENEREISKEELKKYHINDDEELQENDRKVNNEEELDMLDENVEDNNQETEALFDTIADRVLKSKQTSSKIK